MKKTITYIKAIIPLLLGLILIGISLPGLISTIKSFSNTPNAIILAFNLIMLIGSFVPISIGISILIPKYSK